MLDDDLASTQRVTYAFLRCVAALTCDCALETAVILEKGYLQGIGCIPSDLLG